jgi:hypothetical protein
MYKMLVQPAAQITTLHSDLNASQLLLSYLLAGFTESRLIMTTFNSWYLC